MSYLQAALKSIFPKTEPEAVAQAATVPQTQILPGRESEMEHNNAGGAVFVIDDMARLRRFLVLGSEKGSYYVGEAKLTAENVHCVAALVAAGRGCDVVQLVCDFSDKGRAPKQDTALLALAICARSDDPVTRAAAYAALPRVARIPTALFLFVAFSSAIATPSPSPSPSPAVAASASAAARDAAVIAAKRGRGFGKLFRKAVAAWYNSKSPRALAFLATKYANRHGWTHADLLRVAHVKPASASHDRFFHRITVMEKKAALERKAAAAAAAAAAASAAASAPVASAPVASVVGARNGDHDDDWVAVDKIQKVNTSINSRKRIRVVAAKQANLPDLRTLISPIVPSQLSIHEDAAAPAAESENAVAHKYQPKRAPNSDFVMNVDEDTEMESLLSAIDAVRSSSDEEFVAKTIAEYGLAWEHVPTNFLKSITVWNALLPSMGLTAIIRNLGRLTSIELLKPLADATAKVVADLEDVDKLKKARIHPFNVLTALHQYRQGRGDKGSLTWTPVPQIVTALETAFYSSFSLVQPTNLKYMLALDVSGSMSGNLVASGTISCAMGAAAMSMVTARTEKQSHFICFSSEIKTLDITANDSLDDVMRKTSNINFGSTDCAQPMLHAIKHKLDVDVFMVFTDNETYFGTTHPSVALQNYRKVMNKPNAKLIVVAFTATKFSIADPQDPGMLDMCGFDSAAPEIVRDFALGLI